MEVRIFKKENNNGRNAALQIGTILLGATGLAVASINYQNHKNAEATESICNQFGEILGKDHPEKMKLVRIASDEVKKARKEGQRQKFVEGIVMDAVTAMAATAFPIKY